MMTNNNKRRSPLGCLLACVTLAKLIPVVFVLAVLAWSYYAYVVELCFFNVEEWPKKLVYLIVYHVLFVLLSWSYLGAVITKNKRPPAEFYLTDLEVYQLETSQTEAESRQVLERKVRELPILTRTNTGLARYCDKCKCIKPDRAHHCSACSTCVLKMDHHCPWVNNCVGHSNYKFFVLFLGYAVVYCLFVAATSVEYFIKFWSDMQTFKPGKFNLLFMFFVAIMFGVSILTLFAYHLYLLGKNTTTLETFRAPVFSSTGLPDKYGFNLSRLENYKQVFGPSLVKAFLPISTSNLDGVIFPTSTKQTLANHQSASNIQGASDALLLKDKQPTTTMATSPSITLNDQNTAFSINLD